MRRGPKKTVFGETIKLVVHITPRVKEKLRIAVALDHVRQQRVHGQDARLRYTQSALCDNAIKEYLESGKMGRSPTINYETRRVTSIILNEDTSDKFRRFYAQERRRQLAQYGTIDTLNFDLSVYFMVICEWYIDRYNLGDPLKYKSLGEFDPGPKAKQISF